MFVMFPLNKSLYKDFLSTPWQGNQLTIVSLDVIMKTIHSGLMHSAESEVADLFFVVLFLILFVLMLAGLYYLATRFHRFSVIERIALQHPKCAWLLSFSPMLLIVLAMVLISTS